MTQRDTRQRGGREPSPSPPCHCIWCVSLRTQLMLPQLSQGAIPKAKKKCRAGRQIAMVEDLRIAMVEGRPQVIGVVWVGVGGNMCTARVHHASALPFTRKPHEGYSHPWLHSQIRKLTE